MPLKNQRVYSFERRRTFILSLVLSFIVIVGVACIIAYQSYLKAIDTTIRSNETKATLFAKLILEHQRAALGILQVYANQPLLVDSVKRRDFETTLKHLAELVKKNPEMDWPYIANPDSTIWVNFPVDRQAMNKDFSYRDWYKGVSKEWKPYVSRVYKMIIAQKDLAVTISVPIFDESGKVIGIFNTAQSNDFFRKILGESGLNYDAKISLIDQDGQVIYSNKLPYTKEVIGYPPFDFVKKARMGEKGHTTVRDASDKEIRYVSFAPVEGIGWSILVEKSGSEVLRAEYPYFVLTGGIALLVYGILALFFFHIEERHRRIKDLEKVNQELDDRVRERTTELEARNKALFEGRERLRQLIETSPVAIGFGDSLGKIFQANESFYRLTGYTREEIQSRQLGWDQLTAPEYAELDRQIMAKLEATGSAGPYQKEYIRKDGSRVPLLLSVSKFPGRDEHIAFILDITERHRAEEALREAHEQTAWLARFPEENPNPILRVSAEGIVLYCNPATRKLPWWSGKRGGSVGEPLQALVGQVMKEGRELSEEVELGARVYSVSVAPFPAERCANIYGHDITERKRAEEAVAAAHRQIQSLIDNTPALVYALNLEERFVMANSAVAKLLNTAPEQMIGKRRHGFMPKEDADWHEANDRQVIEAGRALEFEEYNQLEGRSITWLTTKFPLRDSQGEIYAVAGISADITDRKKAEEALRQSEARFRLLSETGSRLLAVDDPQRIVEDLCRDVMKYLDCHTFFNFLVDEPAGRLRLNAYSGIPEEEARKIEWLDYGVAVCGCVAQERRRIIAEDIFRVPDPRTDLIKSYGIQAYCCHPLMIQERLIGTLSFGTRTRPSFTSEEVELMRTVTDQVAIAIQRVETERALRQHALRLQQLSETLEQRVKERTAELADLSSQLVSAQENERRRVSYDLHDKVWQMLLAIRVDIERLFSGKEDWAALRTKSKQVTAEIVNLVGRIRSMQGDLWPYVLDDIGLAATIDWYCREFEKEHSRMAIEQTNSIPDAEIPLSAKIVIYRVLQEALSNVAKHSHASRVSLSLAKRDGRIELTIQDNGIGFDPEETIAKRAPWGGLGLLGIKARTELSGGSFDVESAKGQGTTVSASWPV